MVPTATNSPSLFIATLIPKFASGIKSGNSIVLEIEKLLLTFFVYK